MSDGTLRDASTGLPSDEDLLGDDLLGDDLALDLTGDFDDTYLLEEEVGEPVPQPAPRPASQPVEHVDGIDALAEPERPYAAGPARADRPGLRERIRSSRYGTLIVLLITAALVAGGMWAVNGKKASSATAAGGVQAVSIPGKSTVPPPKVGTPAQDFTVTTIDGTKVSLSSYKGKAVWLVFGASWCAACTAEVPEIEAAYKEYGPQGLVILGINITEDSDTVRAYAKRVGITFPIAADPQTAIADAYRVTAIPSHFFIDRTGVLREMRQGSVSAETIPTSLKGLMSQ